MEDAVDPGSVEPAQGVSPRDLGAVCVAVYGLWTVVGTLQEVLPLLLPQEYERLALWDSWALYTVLMLVAGCLLFVLARPIAALVLRDGPKAGLPEAATLMSAGVGLVGLWLSVSYLYALMPMVAPLEAGSRNEAVPLSERLAEIICLAIGVVLFARAGVVARWWGRWNLKR